MNKTKLMMKIFLLAIIFVVSFQCSFAQKNISLSSPDEKLYFSLDLKDGEIAYQIVFKKNILIKESPISFEFDNGNFEKNLKLNKATFSQVDEKYKLIIGKTSTVHSVYKQVIIPIEETAKPNRKINLIVRAFNDGIAFRYEFPKQENWTSYIMYNENTSFTLAENPKATTLFLPSYTSSHEGLYSQLNYDDIQENKLMDMPIMLQYSNNIFMAITEAAVLNYAGMYLVKENGSFISKLSPNLENNKIKVTATLPHQTPWRVFSISDRVGAIIESNILTNLNEPCKIEDISWIKPGKTTFPWWNGNILPDTISNPGINFVSNKYYIDFAARNKLQYHSIYGYGQQPWYTDDGFDFSAIGKNTDILTPVSSLDMKEICDYAHSKGVGIHLWSNWKALYPKIDEAFAKFQEWGISGMMVDFLNRDDQVMIKIQEEIVSKAAKHHLFIQFHGSSKPSGLNRTYPNEFTREGTLNYEAYKWGDDIDANHDIAIPFTRLLAGATDYHLGGFRAVPKSEFKHKYTHPEVLSTRCHMLAMYVVLESYLGMVCDTPDAYEGQDGFEYINELPSTWDEIKVLTASVNEYVTIARRNKNTWYVGTLNNTTVRNIPVSLDFLGDGNYTAEIYTDAKDADKKPNHLIKESKFVTKKDIIILQLAASGGSVMKIQTY
jgi:alpha-glucosidase